MKFNYFLFLAATAAILTACGGGGGDAPASASANSGSATSFATYVGTYKTGCQTLNLNQTVGNRYSYIYTVVVSADGNVTGKEEEFDAPASISAPCVPSYLVSDVTVIGTAFLLGTTKNITAAKSTKTGVAQLANFNYRGFKLSKGLLSNFGTIPMDGATTKIGFLVEGSQVYVLSGSRKSSTDGLPDSFSSNVLVKQ